MELKTLEEALQEIVRLNGELDTTKNTLTNLQNEHDKQTAELKKVQGINHEYFLQLTQKELPSLEQDEEAHEPVQTLEEFAATITI